MIIKSFVLEVTVVVDEEIVSTEETLEAKKKQIRLAIESLDPSVGIFTVESCREVL